MFTANSPLTTGAQRRAVLSLWKRVWAGKEALLSVEKTVLITGQKLTEALQINKEHLAFTDLKEYQTIANSFKSTLNEALIRVREQARFSVLFYWLLL